MYDRINLIEKFRRKLPNVSEDLAIEQRFREEVRPGEAVGEISSVKADQHGVYKIFTKKSCQDRTDISHVARNQNAHFLFSESLPNCSEAARESRTNWAEEIYTNLTWITTSNVTPLDV